MDVMLVMMVQIVMMLEAWGVLEPSIWASFRGTFTNNDSHNAPFCHKTCNGLLHETSGVPLFWDHLGKSA